VPLAVGAWSPGLPAAAVLSCSRRPFLIWEAAWLTLTAASYVCEEGSTRPLCTTVSVVQLAAA
jgi:hypothetical protein